MTGLIGALELTPNKASRAAFAAREGTVGAICRDIAFREGLVMRAVRDSMVLAPPSTFSHDEADLLIELAARILDRTYDEAKRRDLLQSAARTG